MEELTIQEKAERYDKSLERASNLHKDAVEMENSIVAKTCEIIFPELNESEGENIRKELITHFRNTKCVTEEGAERIVKWIAWLEKQGEQKPAIEMITPEESLGISSEEWNKIEDECIFGDDKPKFKVGDWVVNNISKDVFLIKSINSGYCTLEDTKGNIISPCLPPIENESHLWTIQDAKNGDVLVDNDNNIGIYKEIEGICWHSYIYLGCDNRLYGLSIGGSHTLHNTKLATKEQRDLLFQKMKEAGYKLDKDFNAIKI